jgi:hypothetical protein
MFVHKLYSVLLFLFSLFFFPVCVCIAETHGTFTKAKLKETQDFISCAVITILLNFGRMLMQQLLSKTLQDVVLHLIAF